MPGNSSPQSSRIKFLLWHCVMPAASSQAAARPTLNCGYDGKAVHCCRLLAPPLRRDPTPRGSRRALGDLILFFWSNRLKIKPVAIENINTSYNPIFVLLWSLLFLLTWLLVARQLTISRPGPRPGSGESRDKCTMIYSIVFIVR